MIKNIVFDFGKVLVDYDFMQLLDGHFGSDVERKEQFCRLFLDQRFIDRCDREEIPFADIIEEEKKAHPELANDLQFFFDYYADFVLGEMPGMKDLLGLLRRKGYRLYGLTNWCSAVYEVMRRYEEIFSLLDGRIISSEEHVIKPEKKIYEILCNKYGLKAEECLFADDKPVNVDGARKAGLNAVVFTDAESFISSLRSYGVDLD